MLDDDNTHLLKWKRSMRKNLINCLALIENQGMPTQELAYALAKAKECFGYWKTDAELWEKHTARIIIPSENERPIDLDE